MWVGYTLGMAEEQKTKQVTMGLFDIPLEGGTDVPSVYTNHGRIQMTQWDARLLFSEIIIASGAVNAPNTNPDIRNVARANIVMSPAHAKAFLKAFQEQVDIWEKTYGEIKVVTAPDPPPSKK